MSTTSAHSRVFKAFKATDIDRIPQLSRLSPDALLATKAVSHVLPFRVNNYIIDELIDWNDLPNDPIFQLTIPQPDMLSKEDLQPIIALLRKGADQKAIREQARKIQMRLNPHPAEQMELNVPLEEEGSLNGMQHKYRETVLFFPSQGQTCHAYCTYCFRWAQFVGIDDLKFASREADLLKDYLTRHDEVSDVLFTGGDPMIMKTKLLRRYIEPLLNIPTLDTIRIGTKAPAYWPYRFVTDADADDLMRLFEEIVAAGKHLAVMAHFSHHRELSTPIAEQAIRRIRSTGAEVRCQAPLIRHVNDDPQIWNTMWRKQVQLGAIPYYMFVERDTGPKHYFEVPLARALDIFSQAYTTISGLGRTVRGPSMSATPGKVLVDGILEIDDRKYFALKFIQGRNPEWVNKVFLAEYDEKATWLSNLVPAFGKPEFFFEEELRRMRDEKIALLHKKREAMSRQLSAVPN